jgi:hypothetical protein
MIYHKFSIVGYMLWVRYALLRFRPFLNLDYIYSSYLESPGTKAYSIKEARYLFKQFRSIEIRTLLSHGDLLTSQVGQRHRGLLLNIARIAFPRFLIRKLFNKHGLLMFIEAIK